MLLFCSSKLWHIYTVSFDAFDHPTQHPIFSFLDLHTCINSIGWERKMHCVVWCVGGRQCNRSANIDTAAASRWAECCHVCRWRWRQELSILLTFNFLSLSIWCLVWKFCMLHLAQLCNLQAVQASVFNTCTSVTVVLYFEHSCLCTSLLNTDNEAQTWVLEAFS